MCVVITIIISVIYPSNVISVICAYFCLCVTVCYVCACVCVCVCACVCARASMCSDCYCIMIQPGLPVHAIYERVPRVCVSACVRLRVCVSAHV